MNKYRFQPDYAVPPGETLQEELTSRGMTQVELADRTGMAKKTINEIIKGKAPITPDTALKFEHVFGLPAHFWNALEQNYQETKARLAEQDRLKADLEWLRRFPVREMIKRGWLRRCQDKVHQIGGTADVLRHLLDPFVGNSMGKSPDGLSPITKGHCSTGSCISLAATRRARRSTIGLCPLSGNPIS